MTASAEHRDNSKVQAGVAGSLRNLSVNDEIAEEIATAGGIDALITASQEHPNNSDVQVEQPPLPDKAQPSSSLSADGKAPPP